MTALLRADGWTVNAKRVERIWRREGLNRRSAAREGAIQTAEALTAVAERRIVRAATADPPRSHVVLRLRAGPNP